MSTMQIVFSIIGLVLIAGIIGHGVWTLRRNERAQRERANELEQKRQQASDDGFDEDGIGAVRVIKSAPRTTVTEPLPTVADEPQDTATPEPPSMRATAEDELELPTMAAAADDRVEPAPAADASPATASSRVQPSTQPTQQSMELPLTPSEDEPVLTEEPEEVIVLHVTGQIEGTILLQQMTELGFKFGEFDIFHRHVDTAGNGAVLFSLANMFNPGTFNIDMLETFQTEGVALFLALPIKSNSLQAFTMMHNAAAKLAQAVPHGQVLDEHRNPLTRQAIQHIHQRIREFERKRLIKHSQ